MSLFNWFSRKRPEGGFPLSESSGLGHVDPTQPLVGDRPMPVAQGHAANRKSERLERRESLYGVVRDAMIRAGVLAAHYKFKVLSLDGRGLQYLIMVDLARNAGDDGQRLAEIESLIAQVAKARHGILVSAVYWRVNEHVTAGLSPRKPEEAGAHLLHAALTPSPHSPYKALKTEELAAFKRALAGAGAANPPVQGQVVSSGRRNPAVAHGFEETQMTDPAQRSTPLSSTQYGDLR